MKLRAQVTDIVSITHGGGVKVTAKSPAGSAGHTQVEVTLILRAADAVAVPFGSVITVETS